MKQVQYPKITNDLESEQKKARQLAIIGGLIMLGALAVLAVVLFR